MSPRASHTSRIAGTQYATLDGKTVSYTIRLSKRAKCVRLEMKHSTGLVLVIPPSCDLAQLPGIVESKKRWILRNLPRYTCPPWDGTVPYLGRNLKLVKRQNGANISAVTLEERSLIVTLGDGHALDAVLKAWYRIRANGVLPPRVDKLSSKTGLAYKRLGIRGQRTRWGSCSRAGNLNLNWKLVMMPEAVIDYVIVHELAHLKEMNHSPGFWKLVAGHCPRWREHRQWLREHEHYLAGFPLSGRD